MSQFLTFQIKTLLLVLVMIYSRQVHALSCEYLFQTKTEQLLMKKMNFYPELKIYINFILENPNADLKTKRLLKWFINHPNIKLDFYSNAPEEYKSGESIAFNISSFNKINFLKDGELDFTKIYPHLKHEPFELNINETGEVFSSEIYLPNRGDYNIESQFGFLIHEIAHVKFNEFLDRNVEKYIDHFPTSVLNTEKGDVYMSEGLFNFLSERYAYETEYKVTTHFFNESYDEKLGIQSLTSIYKDMEKVIINELEPTHQNLMPSISFAKGQRIFDILMTYRH